MTKAEESLKIRNTKQGMILVVTESGFYFSTICSGHKKHQTENSLLNVDTLVARDGVARRKVKPQYSVLGTVRPPSPGRGTGNCNGCVVVGGDGGIGVDFIEGPRVDVLVSFVFY